MQLSIISLLMTCLSASLATAQNTVQTEAVMAVNIAAPATTTFATVTLGRRQGIVDQSDANFGTTTYNPNNPTGSAGAGDTNAGASGHDSGSFNLSQGAIIAIIVVCVVVVILGIASTVLFIVAKRRQWNVRASIARASRRLTGRFTGAKDNGRSERSDAARRRATQIVPPAGAKASAPKRDVVVEVQPMQELGKQSGKADKVSEQPSKGRGWTKLTNTSSK